jgi:hypothetical protein
MTTSSSLPTRCQSDAAGVVAGGADRLQPRGGGGDGAYVRTDRRGLVKRADRFRGGRSAADFRAAYRDLEARMKALAEADGDVFLPNPEPLGPVDYVFVCMEPSLARWARSPDEAKAKVEAGFRNFVFSIEDFILHFCIKQYLCEPKQRYHITDLSKGAMLVERAGIARTHRYDKWYELLVEEVDLVATSGARIFAVGKTVAQHLARRAFPRPFSTVIHYSGQAARARAASIVGHEDSFEHFRNSVSLQLVLATAEEVLNASVPAGFRDETLARLTGSQLSESRQQLIFNYKIAFESQT